MIEGGFLNADRYVFNRADSADVGIGFDGGGLVDRNVIGGQAGEGSELGDQAGVIEAIAQRQDIFPRFEVRGGTVRRGNDQAGLSGF